MTERIPYAEYKRLPRAAQLALSRAVRAEAPARRQRTARAQSAPRAPRRATRVSVPRTRTWGERALTFAEGALPLAMAGMKLAGFGDYAPMTSVPTSNAFMDAIMTHGPPALHTTSQRSFVVRHREYIGDVITGATAAFNIVNYPINPGIADTFPWLPQIAQNFEQYRVNGMVFEFKSTSADALNSTNTALGSIVMATEYNSDSDPFISKGQMENHEFASSCRQSSSMLHAVECKRSLTPISELYVRQAEPPSGQDLRLYDLGRFSIATVGQQGASVNIGELWVTYEIELLKPQIPDSPSGVETFQYWNATAVSTSAYFGTVASGTPNAANSLDITLGTATITFPTSVPVGAQYLLEFYWYGAAAACAAVTSSLAGCTAVVINKNHTVAQIDSASAAGTLMSSYIISVTNPAACVITLSSGTLPAATCSVNFLVTRVDSQVD